LVVYSSIMIGRMLPQFNAICLKQNLLLYGLMRE